MEQVKKVVWLVMAITSMEALRPPKVKLRASVIVPVKLPEPYLRVTELLVRAPEYSGLILLQLVQVEAATAKLLLPESMMRLKVCPPITTGAVQSQPFDPRRGT